MWYTLVWQKGTTVCSQGEEGKEQGCIQKFLSPGTHPRAQLALSVAEDSKSSLQSHENHFLRRE